MATDNSTTFIYGLVDPVTNQLRYIGKSDNPRVRYRKHVTDKSGSHKSNWIQQLRKSGQLPWMIIIDVVPSCDWQRYERDLIECGCEHLTNIATGGIGAVPSDETREKMRIAKIGVAPHNKGQRTPLEIRQKQSVSAKLRYERMTDAERESFTARAHSNRTPESYSISGWHHTSEAKLKIGAAQKGNKKTAALTREQVALVVEILNVRALPIKDIALMFGVSVPTISNIRRGKSYADWTGIDVLEMKHGKRYKHVKRPED